VNRDQYKIHDGGGVLICMCLSTRERVAKGRERGYGVASAFLRGKEEGEGERRAE
jgi:hypothetical protein